jgi:hypothetical protein
MKYAEQYSNGQPPKTICEGDLIWWNEGVCVGFVEEVMEDPSDYERWGLDQPSIAFTNLHPFKANAEKHKQHIGFVTTGATVVHPFDRQHLEDEGVGPLTPHERSELAWAISEAKSRVDSTYHNCPYCVSALKDMEHGEEAWHFHFVDLECQIVQTVVFPFRPNTRTKEGEQGGYGDAEEAV